MTTLPITAILEERREYNNQHGTRGRKLELDFILPQVRTLEEEHIAHYNDMEQSYQEKLYVALQNEIRILDYIDKAKEKAKEEERERTIQQVVGILEEMKNERVGKIHRWHDSTAIDTLQEVITRITNK